MAVDVGSATQSKSPLNLVSDRLASHFPGNVSSQEVSTVMGNMLFAFMGSLVSTLLLGLGQASQAAIAEKPTDAAAAWQVAYAALLEQNTPPPPPPQQKQTPAPALPPVHVKVKEYSDCEPCKQYASAPAKKALPNVHTDKTNVMHSYRGRWVRRSFRFR